MALNDYVLNGPSTVILDDDRDPDVSWQHHLDRTHGQRGGVDLVAQTSQPVYAPTDGVMDWRPQDGSAGNSCRFWHKHNEGWADVFSHLSSYVGRDMQEFKQGELIAYTGATGGVTAHLHRHLLDPNGNRQNPWHYFTGSAPAGGDTNTIGEDEMTADERAALFNIQASQGRVELHVWHIHKVIDELRYVLIGDEPSDDIRLKLAEIGAELDALVPPKQ